MARMVSATSVRKRDAYDSFRDAARLEEYDSAAVEALRTTATRLLIGDKSKGLTTTCVGNMRRRLAEELRRDEMQAVADGILLEVQKDFPGAEVKIRRGRVIEVWLDGLPEEDI